LSTLLLLTNALQPSAEVLPGLALLGHQVKILPAEGTCCWSTAARTSPTRETSAG
jgi:hypothetical protein